MTTAYTLKTDDVDDFIGPRRPANTVNRVCRICGRHETPSTPLDLGVYINDDDNRRVVLLCNRCNR